MPIPAPPALHASALLAVLVVGCGRLGYDEIAASVDATVPTDGPDAALDGAMGADAGKDGGFSFPDGSTGVAIVNVSPRWSLPPGSRVKVLLAGDATGARITIDGVSCGSPVTIAPGAIECTAAPRAPASVPVQVTNEAGESATYDRDFTYLTPGVYQHGGGADDRTSGVAVDRNGNVYVTGGTNGDLDGPSAGDFDALLIKYEASGSIGWVRQLGTALWDYSRDVAVQPDGDVTIAGYGDGDIDGDGGTAGGNDIFVARYSPAGDLRWVTQLGSPGDDQAWDLGVDARGGVVLAARTDDVMDGGANAGGLDYVIVRLSSAGDVEWVRQEGTASDDYGHSVAVHPDGVAFLVGYTAGSLESGVANAGGDDLYIARYEIDGTRTWIRQRGSTAEDRALDVTVDPLGRVWVVGYTAGALDGNPFAGTRDLFLMRWEPTGDWLFTRQRGSAGTEQTWGVSADPSGQVYVSCVTNGEFDGQTNAGGNDFCMVSYDVDGNHLWTRIAGTAGNDTSSSCAVDVAHTGLVYMSLITDSSLDGMPNRGMGDVALVKLDQTGNVL